MEDLTGTQLGPYRVVAPLGEGGMAALYKAYQPNMERYVALKVLPRHFAQDPQFIGRFSQEAKVLAKLQHPHILPVFDFGEADGYTYLAMPFVESGTLRDLLRAQPLPVTRIATIISQVGDALDYAHSLGLVHRDVKPSNVLMDRRGNCLLTDFGIAKIVGGTSQFTSTGGVIGTPAYMSPEQGSGAKVDARTDIYALGVVLYEMATGHVPFDAETPVAVIFKHIQDPLPPPRALNPDLPDSIERVILKALAKAPDDRYQTAGAMVQALQAAVQEIREADRLQLSGLQSARPDATLASGSIAAGALRPPQRAREAPAASGLRRPAWALLLGVLAAMALAAVTALAAVVVYWRASSGPIAAGLPTAAAEATATEGAIPIPTRPQAGSGPAPTPTAASPGGVAPGKVGRLCLAAAGDVDDRGFNQLAWSGVQRAAADHGAQSTYLVSAQEGETAGTIDAFLTSDCDLIIAVGFTFGAAVEAAAESHPDQKFVILDVAYDAPPPNVWAQTYATEQAAFLAGYVAASVTQTGKVGTFGGMDIPPVVDFLNGYALGVDYYNQKNGARVEVLGWEMRTQRGEFANGFSAPAEGKAIAASLMARGADVIFPVAGLTGFGAGEAALAQQGVHVIGVDTDWALSRPEYAGVTLTSVEKRLDMSVVSAVNAYAEGAFRGGENVLGSLENGETGIASFHELDSLVSSQVRSDLTQIMADIAEGKIQTRP